MGTSVRAAAMCGHARPALDEKYSRPINDLKEIEMPKMKTKSGAKKRFRFTATGKVKMSPSRKRHGMVNRPKKMKRQARGMEIMRECDANLVRIYMPYAR
jgi:large subunit ribosomal protein L35